MASLFGAYLSNHVGDCYSADPIMTAFASIAAVKDICALLGLTLSPEKDCAPSPSIILIGAFIRIVGDAIAADLPSVRMGALSA